MTPSHPRSPTSKTAPPPPPKQHATCLAEIAALRAEIEALRRKMAELLEHQPPLSPHTILTMAPVPTQPPHPPPSSVALAQSRTAHPDHPWLQHVLDHKHCPPFIKSIDSTMVPCLRYAIPDDVQQVLQVQSQTFPPIYIGIDSNSDFQVAREADGDLITVSIAMLLEWSPHSPFTLPPLSGLRYSMLLVLIVSH